MRKFLCRCVYILFAHLSKKRHVTFLSNYPTDIYGNLSAAYGALQYREKCFITKKARPSLFDDLKTIRVIAASRILVVDTMNYFVRILPVSPATTVVFCGHGGGLLKKMAFAAHAAEAANPRSFRKMAQFYGKINYAVSSSPGIERQFMANYLLPKENILAYGLPRTDVLFTLDPTAVRARYAEIRPEIRTRQTVLYAPTFRTRRGKRTAPLDIDAELFDKETNGHYLVLYRRHPTANPGALPPQWLDVTNFPYFDVLALADILVTDFSSIIFDFAFFRRPVFMLLSDEVDYRKTQRDLWTNPEQLVGKQAVCKTTLDLTQALARLARNPCRHRIWEQFMDACDGQSAQRLSAFLVMRMEAANVGK